MTDPDPRPVLDLEVVNSLRLLDEEGGPSLFEELIDLFFEDVPAQLSSMRSALDAGDVKTLTRAAHTLKSSSANLGASRLSGICFELEKLGRSGSLEGAESLIASTGEAFGQVREVLVGMRS